MDTSGAHRSLFTPSKSKKKILESSSVDHSWSSKTPEKPLAPPRRSTRARNRGVALSVKEVKEIAKGLHESTPNRSRQRDEIVGSGVQVPGVQIKSPVGRSKNMHSPIKLPEKYEILGDFFNSMDSSIRLLRMKGSMPTFASVSRQIECLTDRRFLYGHLAQMKFILPEAIEAKKVLILDEQTSCMKPDLRIALNADAMENEENPKSLSGNLLLRKVFRSRLIEFFKTHPEGDDIPKESLPEPFNQSKLDAQIKDYTTSQSPGTSIEAQQEQKPPVASHLSQSFCRQFSKKISSSEAEKFHQKLLKDSLQSSTLPVLDFLEKIPQNEETSSSVGPSNFKLSSKPAASLQSPTRKTPGKKKASMRNELCLIEPTDDIQGTPVKRCSTPAKLMTLTPALQPPKRSCMSPDDCSTSSPNKLVRRPPRSLKFDTPVKSAKVRNEEKGIRCFSVDDDILDILPENLLQSIREKERKAVEERDPAISQAKRRREMLAALPKLFNKIHFFFQSIKRSVITKEELVHNIIAGHCEIVDRCEVEDQLKLLQELVPEWIHEKVALSGDRLLCINKGSSPDTLRQKLANAN